MSELLEIYDNKGSGLGQYIKRDLVHKLGLNHKVFHLWLFNEAGEIGISYRALDKDLFAGYWDVSSGGHVGVDENNSYECLCREINEELGLSVDDLRDLRCVFSSSDHFVDWANNINNLEFVDVYFAKVSDFDNKFKFRDGEVSDFKFISLDKYRSLLIDSDFYKCGYKPGDDINCRSVCKGDQVRFVPHRYLEDLFIYDFDKIDAYLSVDLDKAQGIDVNSCCDIRELYFNLGDINRHALDFSNFDLGDI